MAPQVGNGNPAMPLPQQNQAPAPAHYAAPQGMPAMPDMLQPLAGCCEKGFCAQVKEFCVDIWDGFTSKIIQFWNWIRGNRENTETVETLRDFLAVNDRTEAEIRQYVGWLSDNEVRELKEKIFELENPQNVPADFDWAAHVIAGTPNGRADITAEVMNLQDANGLFRRAVKEVVDVEHHPGVRAAKTTLVAARQELADAQAPDAAHNAGVVAAEQAFDRARVVLTAAQNAAIAPQQFDVDNARVNFNRIAAGIVINHAEIAARPVVVAAREAIILAQGALAAAQNPAAAHNAAIFAAEGEIADAQIVANRAQLVLLAFRLRGLEVGGQDALDAEAALVARQTALADARIAARNAINAAGQAVAARQADLVNVLATEEANTRAALLAPEQQALTNAEQALVVAQAAVAANPAVVAAQGTVDARQAELTAAQTVANDAIAAVQGRVNDAQTALDTAKAAARQVAAGM